MLKQATGPKDRAVKRFNIGTKGKLIPSKAILIEFMDTETPMAIHRRFQTYSGPIQPNRERESYNCNGFGHKHNNTKQKLYVDNEPTLEHARSNTRENLSASNVVKAATANIIIVTLPKGVRHVKVKQFVDGTSILGKV